jgi:lipopolysaccharide export system permease protein
VKIVKRYFLKEFLKLFAVTSVGLGLLLSLFDLIKRIGSLMPHGPSLGQLALHVALSFPRFFLALMPMAALLCSLYAVSQAARAKETVAVMASGGRLRDLLAPFVAAGLLLSLLGFAVGEFVVPASSLRAQALENAIMGRSTVPSISMDGMMWLRAEDGSVVKMDLYVPEDDTFRGMEIFRIGGTGRLDEIIQADQARYLPSEGAWLLSEVRLYDTRTGEVRHARTYRYSRLAAPSLFTRQIEKPYELGFFELKRYLARLEKAGFRNLKLSVELYSKVSYPLVSLFMVVLGVSISLRKSLRGLVATALGIVVSLLYWLGYTLALTLGYAGVLPPMAAVWLAPLLFGALAAYLYATIPE